MENNSFHLFIINPTAGKNDSSKQLIQEIKSTFQNYQYGIEITQYPKHAIEIVNIYADMYPNLIIYACGGDGTVNEVINGIQLRPIPLAIIPIGSGNDFVRNFSYTLCLNSYLQSSIKKCDLIKVGKHIGLNVISAGFDCAVAKNMYRFRKYGKHCYTLSIAYSIMSSMKHRLGFIIDDTITIEESSLLMAICANGQYYGGGIHVSPYSEITDGYLNFIKVKAISKFQVASFMKIFSNGEHIEKLKKICRYNKM